MIRPVNSSDAQQITDIYNHYILTTTVTFEVEPLTTDQMADRIRAFSALGPYIVDEVDGKILGYAYAHQWKERAAYAHTWETTVYVAPDAHHAHVGSRLMEELIARCRRQPEIWTLIACITETNHASCLFHEYLGFEKVSHFKGVGMKMGQRLDVVDYQLTLK